jgi:hypothetical protein
MSQVIAELFRPDRSQFDKLSALTPPNRADYQPSTGRKISALMAGLGGNRPAGIAGGSPVGFINDPARDKAVSDSILDAPYNNAVADFKLKESPLTKTAELENRRNVNDRMIDSQILRDEQVQRKQTETERQNREMDKIRQQRADAYDFKTRNPQFKAATDDNGQLVFYNPLDPTKTYYSGIQTGKLSDSDKINLEHEGKLSEIQARGKEAKDLESKRQTGRTDLEGVKAANAKELESVKQINRTGLAETNIEGRKEVKAIPSGSSSSVSNRPQTETQKKQGMINKALQIVSENPELKPYIIFEKNNAGTVQGVSISKTGIFGDEAKRMKAYNLLFGQPPVPGVSQDKNVMPQSAGAKTSKNATGQTHVKRKSDGQTGWVTNPDMSKYDLIP